MLDNDLPELLERENVRLIVLDSVAGAFRSSEEFDVRTKADLSMRAGLMCHLARRLKEFSVLHGVCCVVVNQVTSSPTEPLPVAALGPTWSSCVNTRFMLRRKEAAGGGDQSSFQREIGVAFSPYMGPASCQYQIGPGGVRGLESSF